MVHSTALEMLRAQAYVGSNPTPSANWKMFLLARQPFFGEISSRFEFSKAKSMLFFLELKELNNFAIIVL